MDRSRHPEPALRETGIEFRRVEPRLLGHVPPLWLLGTGVLGVPAAIALIVTAHDVLGGLLLVAGLSGLLLYAVAASRVGRPGVGRRVVSGGSRARNGVRFAASSAAAWSRASVRVLALQRELRAVARERDAVQHLLGDAAYAGDEGRVEDLRRRMRALDDRAASCDRRIRAARRVAGARVSRARLSVSRTERLESVSAEAPARRDG